MRMRMKDILLCPANVDRCFEHGGIGKEREKERRRKKKVIDAPNDSKLMRCQRHRSSFWRRKDELREMYEVPLLGKERKRRRLGNAKRRGMTTTRLSKMEKGQSV